MENRLQTVLQTIKVGLQSRKDDTNIEDEVIALINVVSEIAGAEGMETLQFSSSDGSTITQSTDQLSHNTPILDRIKAGTLTKYLVDIDITNVGHYIGFGNSTLTSGQFTILLYGVGLNSFIGSKIILYPNTYLVESSQIATATLTPILEDSYSQFPTNNAVLTVLGNYAETQEVDDFENFDEGTSYETSAIVRHNGKIYKFIADKSAGPWDSTKVSQTSVFAIIQSLDAPLDIASTEVSDPSAATPVDLTSERMAEIDDASELLYTGHKYTRNTLTSELYAIIRTKIAGFASLSNVYVHYLYYGNGATLSITSYDILVLGQDSSSKWHLWSVESD